MDMNLRYIRYNLIVCCARSDARLRLLNNPSQQRFTNNHFRAQQAVTVHCITLENERGSLPPQRLSSKRKLDTKFNFSLIGTCKLSKTSVYNFRFLISFFPHSSIFNRQLLKRRRAVKKNSRRVV